MEIIYLLFGLAVGLLLGIGFTKYFKQKKQLLDISNFENINICDYQSTKNSIKLFKPSHIFHFAANATTKTSEMGWKNPFDDYKINMVGTLNLLEAIRSLNLNK